MVFKVIFIKDNKIIVQKVSLEFRLDCILELNEGSLNSS